MKKKTTAIGFIMLCMANFNNVVDFSENVKHIWPQNIFQNELKYNNNSYINNSYATSTKPMMKDNDGNEVYYDISNLFDGDNNTAWCEGVDGYGIDEEIVIEFVRELDIKSFKISNGYLKSPDLHKKNSSVKKLEVSDQNGNKVILNLSNQLGVQSFDLNFSETSVIRFKILDVHKGSIDDTLITKIEFK